MPHSHDSSEQKQEVTAIWQYYLTTGDMPKGLGSPWFMARRFRPYVKRLPSDPRCRLCDLPFQGVGGFVTRSFLGVVPSSLNPHMCNMCESALRYFNSSARVCDQATHSRPEFLSSQRQIGFRGGPGTYGPRLCPVLGLTYRQFRTVTARR